MAIMYINILADFPTDYKCTAHYFPASNSFWLEPDDSLQVPVRAEIQGIQNQTLFRKFHHIYDYFDFRNKIWGDDSVFEVPLISFTRQCTNIVS